MVNKIYIWYTKNVAHLCFQVVLHFLLGQTCQSLGQTPGWLMTGIKVFKRGGYAPGEMTKERLA